MLQQYMKAGQWTNERLCNTLNGVSLEYLAQVTSGNKAPSPALGIAIRNVLRIPASVGIRELFPAMKAATASSIERGEVTLPVPTRTRQAAIAPSSRRQGSKTIR